MISVKSTGSFDNTKDFLKFLSSDKMFSFIDSYGQLGVDLLSSATPVETGETAHSWSYKVEHKKGRHVLRFYNSHDVDGVNIAIILQYGHGTGTGGYVEGIDYINPAVQPMFDRMVDEMWKGVKNA